MPRRQGNNLREASHAFVIHDIPDNVSPLSDVSIPIIVAHVFATAGFRMDKPDTLEYRRADTERPGERWAHIFVEVPVVAEIICALPFTSSVRFYLMALDQSWRQGQQCPLIPMRASMTESVSTWPEILLEIQSRLLHQPPGAFRAGPVAPEGHSTPPSQRSLPLLLVQPVSWRVLPLAPQTPISSLATSGSRESQPVDRLQAVPMVDPTTGRLPRSFMLLPPEPESDPTPPTDVV